jgi:hypothetical protein
MLKFGPPVFSLALVFICAGTSAAGRAAGDGVVRGDAAATPSAVTLVLPRCANPGTVVQIEVEFPNTDPTDVTVTLNQPTSGPPYLLEQKINKRHYDGSSSATLHNFYIDPFSQIVGTAKVKAVVAGVGSAHGTFVIPC